MIIVDNLYKSYIDDANEKIVLNDISFKVNNSDFCIVYGDSGCGKTTLLNLISSIDVPTKGKIIIDDEIISEYSEDERANFRNTKIGYIFQNFLLEENYSVYDNISLPLLIKGSNNKEIEKKVYEICSMINIKEVLYKKVNHLSGGQKQRVAIARALINNPNLILADEPTGSLDRESGIEIMDLLKSLSCKGITIILVTHNLSYLSYSNNIIHLSDGKIV